MIDYHIHSSVSADCKIPMTLMARAARDAGLTEICFTEHIDLHLIESPDFTVDFDAYRAHIEATRAAFPELTVRMGIESGLNPAAGPEIEALLSRQPLDYVVGSQHVVFGLDPYYKEVWQRYDKRSIFEEYLRTSCQSAALCDFDVMGHIGYISKFCPYEDKLLRYADYSDALDTLLKTLVERGKGLEVNTSGLLMTPDTMPELPIIRRFFELGGEIITIGSDAHKESAVGHAVDATLQTLKIIGFRYVCAFDARKPRFIPLP